jgi:hypothetical protein
MGAFLSSRHQELRPPSTFLKRVLAFAFSRENPLDCGGVAQPALFSEFWMCHVSTFTITTFMRPGCDATVRIFSRRTFRAFAKSCHIRDIVAKMRNLTSSLRVFGLRQAAQPVSSRRAAPSAPRNVSVNLRRRQMEKITNLTRTDVYNGYGDAYDARAGDQNEQPERGAARAAGIASLATLKP